MISLKTLSNGFKILTVGVLIGQYGQPIPLQPRDDGGLVTPALAAVFYDESTGQEDGYTIEQREAMDQLFEQQMPNE